MPDDPVTFLLQAFAQGDRAVFERLTPSVYGELHRLASSYMRRERPNHELSPTELVSEAFLRLVSGEHPAYQDRVQFFAVAAHHMRRILVDHAVDRVRRGRLEKAMALDAASIASDAVLIGRERSEELIALDEALHTLAALDARKARMVELSYFGGLSQQEIATVLSVHENTVARHLRLARAWLHRHINEVAEAVGNVEAATASTSAIERMFRTIRADCKEPHPILRVIDSLIRDVTAVTRTIDLQEIKKLSNAADLRESLHIAEYLASERVGFLKAQFELACQDARKELSDEAVCTALQTGILKDPRSGDLVENWTSRVVFSYKISAELHIEGRSLRRSDLDSLVSSASSGSLPEPGAGS